MQLQANIMSLKETRARQTVINAVYTLSWSIIHNI